MDLKACACRQVCKLAQIDGCRLQRCFAMAIERAIGAGGLLKDTHTCLGEGCAVCLHLGGRELHQTPCQHADAWRGDIRQVADGYDILSVGNGAQVEELVHQSVECNFRERIAIQYHTGNIFGLPDELRGSDVRHTAVGDVQELQSVETTTRKAQSSLTA